MELTMLRGMLTMAVSIAIFYFMPGIAVLSAYHALMLGIITGLANAGMPQLTSVAGFTRSFGSIGIFAFGINTFLLYLFERLHLGFSAASVQSLVVAAATISIISWFATLGSREDKPPST